MVIAFSHVKYAVNRHPGDMVKDASPFPFLFLKFQAFIPHKRAYLQARSTRLFFSKIGQGFKKAFCKTPQELSGSIPWLPAPYSSDLGRAGTNSDRMNLH